VSGPGLYLTALLVLALGIGVNNMLFTILYGHTLRGLPIPAAERVLYLTTTDEKTQDGGVSLREFEELQATARSFAGVAAYASEPVVVGDDGRAPDRLEANYASGSAFGVLGVTLALGRGLEPADDRAGRPAVAVLAHSVWQARYGGDPGVLGDVVLVNGQPATIVGVLAARSGFPSNAALWLPLAQASTGTPQQRELRTLGAFGRLHAGISIHTAAAELEVFFRRLAVERPQTNARVRARTVPINEQYFGRVTDPAWLAFITAGFLIVLISAANVANLMLERGWGRRRELAIRTSLGATRLRLFRQLIVEGIVLATLGGLGGLGVAMVGVRVFRGAMPADALPYWFDYTLDARIVAVLAAVSVFTMLLFAVLPAIQASRTDIAHLLKAGRGVRVSTARNWATAFLAAEIALTAVLLAGFSVNLRSAQPRLPSDPLIDTRAVVTGVVSLPDATYGRPQDRVEFYRKLRKRVRGIPGTTSTSVTTSLPRLGGARQRLHVGAHGVADAASAAILAVEVGPQYFKTLGLTMVRGHEFSGVGTGQDSAAVINERFAKQFFPDRDPIGERITLDAVDGPPTAPRRLTIIGVAPDVRQGPGPNPEPVAYVSYAASPAATATVLVRGDQSVDYLTASLREAVRALDPSLPVYGLRTMRDVVRDSEWVGRISAGLFLALTGIAVGLSAVGLYAVAAHGVTRQTHEIGIRVALGASRWAVIGMVLRGALLRVSIGFIVGIGCTMLWEHQFSSGRPEIRATDPSSLAIVAALLTVVMCVACAVPALRAARVDPLKSIRRD
jgi:putative ABC transport system permease protein